MKSPPSHPVSKAKEWLTDLVAVGFQGLVLDRRGYADEGAAVESEVGATLGQPVLASADGRYGFFDLTAFASDARRTIGDAELAARAREVLARGPLGPTSAGSPPGH